MKFTGKVCQANLKINTHTQLDTFFDFLITLFQNYVNNVLKKAVSLLFSSILTLSR